MQLVKREALIAIVTAAVVFITVQLYHFNGLYGQDAHEYLRLSRAIDTYFKAGTPVSHSYFPLLYPFVGFVFSKISMNDSIALQLVSLFSVFGSFFLLKQLLKEIYSNEIHSNLFLILFFVLSPYVLRFSIVSMSDAFCTMLCIASALFLFKYARQNSRVNSAACSFFISAALSTRYAAIMVLWPLLLCAGYFFMRKKDWKGGLLSILFGCLPLLPDLIIRYRLLFIDLNEQHWNIDYGPNAYSWSLQNFFRNAFVNADGTQHYQQWNIIQVLFNTLHPAFLFAGIAFLFFVKKKDFSIWKNKLLMLMIISYAFFLAGLSYQNNRYLLLSFPFVLILLYPAFERIRQKLLVRRIFGVAIISFAIQVFLFVYSFQSVYQMNRNEQQIASVLKTYPGNTVYTCTMQGVFQSYDVNNPTIDLLNNKVREIKDSSLLLFNYDDFSQHFANMNPMANWNFIQQQYHTTAIQQFDDGWTLYRIN